MFTTRTPASSTRTPIRKTNGAASDTTPAIPASQAHVLARATTSPSIRQPKQSRRAPPSQRPKAVALDKRVAAPPQLTVERVAGRQWFKFDGMPTVSHPRELNAAAARAKQYSASCPP